MTYTDREQHQLDFGSRAILGRNHDLEARHAIATEIWIAGATLAVTAAGTAYGAYSSNKAQQDAAEARAQGIPTVQPYDVVQAKLDPYAGINDYLGSVNQYGYGAARAADTLNTYYQNSVDRLAPVSNSLMAAGNNAARQLRGELPKDLASSIARNAAQANLTNGTGYDSGQGRNYVARDFGKGTLDIQQQGLQNLGVIQGLAQKFTPFNAGNMLPDANSYNSRRDAFEIDNTNRQTQQNALVAGAQNYNANSVYQANIANAQANAYNPAVSAGMSLAGSFAGSANDIYSKYKAGQAANGMNAQGFYGSAAAAQNAYGQYANVAYSPGAGGPNGGGGYYAQGWHG